MDEQVRFVSGGDFGDRLGGLILARPEAHNAFDPAMIAQLVAAAQAAEAAAVRSEIGALLILAEGTNFCVGADLKHFATGNGAFADELAAMATPFHAALELLAALPVPVVGAVQGNAVGAGMGLALVCDMLLLGEDARLSTGYSRLGLSADAGVSYHLTRALGERQARSLLMSSRTIPAAEALAMGLADRIVPTATLRDTATSSAAKLAQGPGAAFAAIKRLTGSAHQLSLPEQLRREEHEIVALARDPGVAARIRAMLS